MAISGQVILSNHGYLKVYFDWTVESQQGMRSSVKYTITQKNLSYGNAFNVYSTPPRLSFQVSNDGLFAPSLNINVNLVSLAAQESRVLFTRTISVTRDAKTNIGMLGFEGTLTGVGMWGAYNTEISLSDYAQQVWEVNTTTTFGQGATLLTAPDFNDEDNPTITYLYDRAPEITSYKLEAAISFTGANDDIPYREISIADGSYTFELTGSERAKLWELLDVGTTASVRFYLKSTETVGAETQYIYTYLTKTLTFVNYKPVLTPLVEDINSDTLRLTGDKYTMVRNMSTAYFNTQAVARKGGTIASIEVRNGDKVVTGLEQEGQIENITSNTFYFTVTDNRGYSTNDAVIFNDLAELKFIDYPKLTCNVSAKPISGVGDLTLTLTGKYFGGDFGTALNKLTVDYDCHIQDEAENWVSLGFVEPTVDSENNYSFTFTINDLVYTSAYQLTIRVNDELMAAVTPTIVVTAKSLFDWSKNDFKFYIPVQMDKGFMYPQTLLWQGAAQMGDNESITLDKPVSEQPTGLVLVFSLYRDNVEDASIHSFFLSRVELDYLLKGKPHMFMMGINSNLSVFGSKYLYINEDSISGFEGNTNSGTAACGITFDNSKFVLRYVIGV